MSKDWKKFAWLAGIFLAAYLLPLEKLVACYRRCASRDAVPVGEGARTRRRTP